MEDKICYCLEFENKNKLIKELRKMTAIAKQKKTTKNKRKNKEKEKTKEISCSFVRVFLFRFFECRAFQLILSVN